MFIRRNYFTNLLYIIIAELLLIFLTACAQGNKQQPSGGASLSGSASFSVSSASSKTEGPSDGFKRGAWENGVYKSAYLSLSFSLPDGFKAQSDEEILAAFSFSDKFDASNLKDAYEQGQQRTIYDMYALSPDGAYVVVMLENLSLTNTGADMTEEEYASSMSNVLRQASAEFIPFDGYETEFCGTEWYVLPVASASNSFSRQYMLKRAGPYMAVVLIDCAVNFEAGISAILDSFEGYR